MGELTHINCVALTARFPVGKPVVPAALMKSANNARGGGLRIGRSSASSLTDSLRSVVRLRRAVSTHSKAVIRLSTESGDNAGKNMQNALRPARETSEHDRRRVPRRPRSGGRPPPPRTRSARRRRHRRRGAPTARRIAVRRVARRGRELRLPRGGRRVRHREHGRLDPGADGRRRPRQRRRRLRRRRSTSPRDHRGRARSSRRSTAVARSSTAPAADRPRPQVRDDPRAGVPRRRRCRGRGARLVDPRQLRGAEGGRGGRRTTANSST